MPLEIFINHSNKWLHGICAKVNALSLDEMDTSPEF